MIMTILEGHVPANRWNDFEHSYREAIKHIPAHLKETFLVQDEHDPNLWRIITVWKSREDFDAIRFDPLYHTCVDIYTSVGTEATRRVFNVVNHHTNV
jgi:hypothetical protein